LLLETEVLPKDSTTLHCGAGYVERAAEFGGGYSVLYHDEVYRPDDAECENRGKAAEEREVAFKSSSKTKVEHHL